MTPPPRRELDLVYLLAGTELFGGTKVALHHANLMARRGHRVTVASPGPPPDWYELEARFLQVGQPLAAPAADVIVATFWTTLAPAQAAVEAAGRGEAAHLCQGFEASYTHNAAEHPAILAAYERRLPCLAVAPHLASLVARRFGRPARVVPQPLEPFWAPSGGRRGDGAEGAGGTAVAAMAAGPRIAVASPFEIDWKGVATALAAVRMLREAGVACRLVRLSQWPLTDAERAILPPDEFHCHLKPPDVARLLAGCDLLLAPSWEQEGFGLPVLEAMACGVPVVASDVACYRDFAASAARLVRFDDPAAFASAAADLLAHPEAWESARENGLRVAAAFSEESAADAAEAALAWVASGAWRSELPPPSPSPSPSPPARP